MQIKIFVAVPAVLGLLISCAQMEHQPPMDLNLAVQSIKTNADHETLAKQYEEAAKKLQAKIQEQKILLERYDAESKRYGQEAEKGIFNTHRLRGDDENYFFAKRAEERKTNSQALIRSYEKAAEENMSMAATHRKMAAEIK